MWTYYYVCAYVYIHVRMYTHVRTCMYNTCIRREGREERKKEEGRTTSRTLYINNVHYTVSWMYIGVRVHMYVHVRRYIVSQSWVYACMFTLVIVRCCHSVSCAWRDEAFSIHPWFCCQCQCIPLHFCMHYMYMCATVSVLASQLPALEYTYMYMYMYTYMYMNKSRTTTP